MCHETVCMFSMHTAFIHVVCVLILYCICLCIRSNILCMPCRWTHQNRSISLLKCKHHCPAEAAFVCAICVHTHTHTNTHTHTHTHTNTHGHHHHIQHTHLYMCNSSTYTLASRHTHLVCRLVAMPFMLPHHHPLSPAHSFHHACPHTLIPPPSPLHPHLSTQHPHPS